MYNGKDQAPADVRKPKKLSLSRETLRVLSTTSRPQYGYTSTDFTIPMTDCTRCCITGCRCP